MNATNAYRDDDTPAATGAGCIDPKALRAARERRGLTQSRLAEAIGCGKDTVSRWERGYSLRLQPRHRDSVCAALGVRWHALAETRFTGRTTFPATAGSDRRSEKTSGRHSVSPRERYDIGVHAVMKAAPLLFVIAAERSLMERRRRLDAARAEVDRAGRALAGNAPYLGRAVEALGPAFEEAVPKRGEIDRRERHIRTPRPDRRGSGRRRRAVRALPPRSRKGPSGDRDEPVRPGLGKRRRLPEAAAGTSGNSAEAPDEDSDRWRLLPHFQAGRIDFREYLRVKRERDETGYREWLSDALARAEGETRERIARPVRK